MYARKIRNLWFFIESSHKSLSPKRHTFFHACVTCFELPSYINTMSLPWRKFCVRACVLGRHLRRSCRLSTPGPLIVNHLALILQHFNSVSIGLDNLEIYDCISERITSLLQKNLKNERIISFNNLALMLQHFNSVSIGLDNSEIYYSLVSWKKASLIVFITNAVFIGFLLAYLITFHILKFNSKTL